MAIAMNSDRAKELQSSIQKELAIKGYSTESDPVMAEYITIMLINSKTPEQITAELSDLIGPDYDHKFTDWLFVEANSSNDEVEETTDAFVEKEVAPAPAEQPAPPTTRTTRVPPTGPRGSAPLLQQALTSITPPKRPRSPSSEGPARKAPRTSDLPDRPRAMREETGAPIPVAPPSGRGRSLLERVGPTPKYQHANGSHQSQPPQYDPIQAQIDAVTGGSGIPLNPSANNFVPGAINGMGLQQSPVQLTEMFNTQMAMMAQMAMQMGIPLGMPLNGNAFNGGMQGNFSGGGGHMNGNGFGQGWQRPGRGGGRVGGRGGQPYGNGNVFSRDSPQPQPQILQQEPPPVVVALQAVAAPQTNSAIVSPQPIPVAAAAPAGSSFPERPGTPTLCKFGLTCTNPSCRYSHPSPSATVESGLVLSNEACEKGVKCDDKDCTKAHPSPAILNPNATAPAPTPSSSYHSSSYKTSHYHPYKSSTSKISSAPGSSSTPCRFGSGCTRASCAFQHPPGRTTLPGEFHRGLKSTDPTVKLSPAAEKARMAQVALANRFNKTVTFNKDGKPISGNITPTNGNVSGSKTPDSSTTAESGSTDGKAGSAVPPNVAQETAAEA